MQAALREIVSHLQAAKTQRLPTDDAIIAEHIDAALAVALAAVEAERNKITTRVVAIDHNGIAHDVSPGVYISPATGARPHG